MNSRTRNNLFDNAKNQFMCIGNQVFMIVVCYFFFFLQDNKINGVTQNTRLLGSSYLFPYVIPDPSVTVTTLQPDDQLIIIANQGLWKCMSYQETVNEIIDIPDPVLAAKKLQDLAQGYHSQENIGVLVIRLMLSKSERNKMRQMLQNQFENEQKLLAELKVRDIEREEQRKKAELEEQAEAVPMDIVKLKGGKKRKQVDRVFSDDQSEKAGDIDEQDGVKVRPLPGYHGHSNEDPAANWELMLQKRLTEEVKDKELIHAMCVQEYDPYFPTMDSDENWSTTSKLKGQLKERTVTLPPNEDYGTSSPPQIPPPPLHLPRRQIIPEAAQISTESLEFRRELKHPLNVDRDAILFHNMQLSRHKNHNISSHSIDSIQSDPAYSSVKEILKDKKSSSHSIEVLIHGPAGQPAKTESFGGSHNLPKHVLELPNRNSQGDSCPVDMNERLKMLEQKGFLPSENENESKSKTRKADRRLTADEIERNLSKTKEQSCSEDTLTDQNVNDNDNIDSQIDLDESEMVSHYDTIKHVVEQHSDESDKQKEIMIIGEIYSAPSGQDSGIRDNEHLNWWSGRKSNSAEGLPEKEKNADDDLTELYATVRKVKKKYDENRELDSDNSANNVTIQNSGYEVFKAENEEADSKYGTVKSSAQVINKKTSPAKEKQVITINLFGANRTPPPVPKKRLLEEMDNIDDNMKDPKGQTDKSNGAITKSETKSHGAIKKPAPTVNGVQRKSPEVKQKEASHVQQVQEKSNFVQQQLQKYTVKDTKTDEKNRDKEHVDQRTKYSKPPTAFMPRSEERIASEGNTADNDKTKTFSVTESQKSDAMQKTSNNGIPLTEDKKVISRDLEHEESQQSVSSNSAMPHKKRHPPPIPPRMPIKPPPVLKPDINSNSIKSLEDLIAYNRLQQQKVSYKVTPKVAPAPPPKVPETSMVTKTASQRSIIITYL